MPTHKFPKKSKGHDKQSINSEDSMRTVYFPVNEAILNAVALNDEAEIILQGKIIGIFKDESEDYQKRKIKVELYEISVHPDGGGMAAKDFERGYRKGMEEKA